MCPGGAPLANFCCEKLARNQVGQSGQSLKVVSARRARAMNDAVALLRATPRMLADAVVASAEENRDCARVQACSGARRAGKARHFERQAQRCPTAEPRDEARAREEARHGQAVTLSVCVRALFVDDRRGGEETSTDEGCEATTHDETARRQRTTRQR